MNKEIVSCPFCGKEPEITLLDENRLDTARYTCKTINCVGNSIWAPFYLWIRRVYPPEIRAVLDAAEELAKTQTYWKNSLDAERFSTMQNAVRDYKEWKNKE